MRTRERSVLVDGLWFAYIAVVFLALTRFSVVGVFCGKRGTYLVPHVGSVCQPLSAVSFTMQIFLVSEYLAACYFFHACLTASKKYGVPTLLGMWFLVLLDLSFIATTGHQAGLADIAILNISADWGAIGDALLHFSSGLAKSAAYSSPLFVPLIARSLTQRGGGRYLKVAVSFSLLATMYLALVLYVAVRGANEGVLQQFPVGFSYLFGSTSLKLSSAVERSQTLNVGPFDGEHVDKIVVVIDESIDYDVFARNYSAARSDTIDYGRAFSGANFTASSQLILRKAGWIARAGTAGTVVVERIESLFSLAKRAGYRTFFVDNWHLDRNDVYLDGPERASIDGFLTSDVPLYDRDLASVETIVEALKQPKVFIFVEKVGAHYPYASVIPPERRSAGGQDLAHDYEEAVKRNGVAFLEALRDRIDADTLLFYTSDHGENLSLSNPHGNTGPELTDTEYLVPLLLVAKNPSLNARLVANEASYRNRMSHLEFSESIRNAMGYAVTGIDSLFKPPEHGTEGFCGVWGAPFNSLGLQSQCRPLH